VIKEILLIAICVSVGVGIYLFLNPSAMTVAQNFFSPIITPITTQIGNIANAIPSPIKEILGIISIPSIISTVFFAWTKLRAMNYAKQVEQQATQEITSLSGKVEGVKDAAGVYSESTVDKITTLAQDLESTRTLLAEKQQEIRDWETKETIWDKSRLRMDEEMRTLRVKLNDLQDKYDIATGVKKAPIT